jgi:hypothetical protein
MGQRRGGTVRARDVPRARCSGGCIMLKGDWPGMVSPSPVECGVSKTNLFRYRVFIAFTVGF